MVLRFIDAVGGATIAFVDHLGQMAIFAGQVAWEAVRPPYRWKLLLKEIYKAGVLSLIIVGVSALAVGMVLGLQLHNVLVRYGATGALGSAVGLSLVRELGPVLTALLVAGRAGSATTAEIGTMVATEQLDGLRMMSVSPIDLIVVPRALAMIIVMPLLAALFDVIGIGGGYLIAVGLMGVYGGQYEGNLVASVSFGQDVMATVDKAIVFGLLVGLISTFRGITAAPNSAGVSAATTNTVVVSSVSILIFDFFITALWGFSL